MRYLTDRKRAQGLGAGGSGTEHHWQMLVGSTLLVPLVPLIVFILGCGIGGTREQVMAYFSKPFPAIFTAIGLVVIVLHLKREAQEAIEDYMHGIAEKLTLIAVSALCYTLIAAGLFALIKLAL